MNTTSNAVQKSNREFFQQKEAAVLRQIIGVRELASAKSDARPALIQKYPDAAFALYITSNLFFHDRELTNIHMNAYTAILNGERLADIRFRFVKEMDAYDKRHNWD